MPSSSPDLSDRHLLLGVTGSIAAYKAAFLVRLFRESGAEVRVMMTSDAQRFVSDLTLGTLSENEVLTDIFPENEEGSWTKHVTLGEWADLFVVAPATAQTIAKLAHGFCDSMLTATALSARCPLLVCPAMDREMYRHRATRENLERLREIGYHVMPAAHGELASGLVGRGRMPEPEAIRERVGDMLSDRAAETEEDRARAKHSSALNGTTVLVTAGPTQEPFDPVRVLTNRSTGTMGHALARAAAARGGNVTLVTGPTSLSPPNGVEVIRVETAEEMNEAVQARADAELVLMAAAVADYTPTDPAPTKRKKDEDDLVLHLRRTPDILKTLGENKRSGQVLVGFAMETGNGLEKARRKLEEKNLDWIVLNDLTEDGAGFGPSTNRVTLLSRGGATEDLPLMSKSDVAEAILDRVVGTDDA